ncbi:hypothetical protein GGR51DRAFT_527089 [Nemania sp. FL0031]|nr:hypothetical protein GGR51DRAFT_527089 [Nemania sp. FL0031]
MSSKGVVVAPGAPGAPAHFLPCEFVGYKSCDTVFAIDDVESWIEHIISEHLQGKLPRIALCWFCDDITFDSKGSQDRRTNFVQRMWHIREHILLEGKTVNDVRPDYYFNLHLHDHQILPETFYNLAHRYSEGPKYVEAPREEAPKTYQQIHSPIHPPKWPDDLAEEPPHVYIQAETMGSGNSTEAKIPSKAEPAPTLTQDVFEPQYSPTLSTSAHRQISASSKHLGGYDQEASMSDDELRWRLSDYCVIRFEKLDAGLGEDGQPISPGWERCLRTEDQGVSKKAAHAHVKDLNKYTRNVIEKERSLNPVLKLQVDVALKALGTHDPDMVNFHWTLAQLDHQSKMIKRAMRGQIGHTDSKRKRNVGRRKGKKIYERVSLTAYFKRSPRPGVDLWRLWGISISELSNLAKATSYLPKADKEEQHKVPVDAQFDQDDLDSYCEGSSCPEPEEHMDSDEASQRMDNKHEETTIAFKHASKAKSITTEQLSLSNSGFDSGYRSLSVAKQTLDSVNEIGTTTGQDFLYSEAGSLETGTDNYAQYLADEVIIKLNNELRDVDWGKFRTALSDLLREFAIRVGNEGETQSHRDLMYWTHKWHEDIAKHIEKQQVLHDDDYEDELQEKEGDPDWRDRIGLLFDRDDQDLTQENTPTQEGKALAAIEIEPYQQIISSSRAFEWLVSSIRNSMILSTAKDNTMDTVKQQILQMLNLLDQKRGYGEARISRHRNPTSYRVCFTLDWPSARSYQEGSSFKTLSDVFERVLTITGDSTQAQALLCEDYILQTWPSTGPLLIQSILKVLKRGSKTKGISDPFHDQDSLIKVQISGEVMHVYRQGNIFELAEMGTQLAWLASALLPQPKLNQGVNCKPRVCFNRPNSGNAKQRGEVEDLHCHFDVTTTTFDLGKVSRTNGNCWHTVMGNFAIVDGFPIRSRPSGKLGLDIPLSIAADFVGTRKVTRFKGRPLIKGFSTLLCPISWEDGIVYWHVLKSELGRISFADVRIDSMSVIEPGSLKLRDLENSRHIVGWCTEVEQFAGTIDANLNIRRVDLKPPPNEWDVKEIQVGGGQYINVLATFAVRKDQKSLQIERDRSDYSGNMEWIARRHVILHNTEASERRAWLIDGASALLYLVFASLWKNQHGVLRDSYTFDFEQLKGFFSSRPAGMATSLSVLMNPKFLGTKLRARDPMNPSDWYLLRDRVNETFDLLSQIIDHQEDISPGNGLGNFVSFSPWKQHVGWAFADIASPGEPCNLKATYLKQHGEGWVYFARELHAITLFGHGFGNLLRPATVTPDPCNRCLWGSLAPKGGDILAVSLENLKSHSESSDQRRLEMRCILGQRLSSESHGSCFRACSRDSCTCQRIQTFHRVSGKGYNPVWENASLPELDEGYSSINGAALLGIRARGRLKWTRSSKKRDQQQPDDLHQSQVDPDELCVVDGVSISTTQSSSLDLSHDSIQMTSIQTPSTPGSSIPSRHRDSSSTIDEAIGNTPYHTSKGKTPIRRMQDGANDWVRKLKSPQNTS